MKTKKEIQEQLENIEYIKKIAGELNEGTKKDKIQANTMINTLRWVLEIDEREI